MISQGGLGIDPMFERGAACLTGGMLAANHIGQRPSQLAKMWNSAMTPLGVGTRRKIVDRTRSGRATGDRAECQRLRRSTITGMASRIMWMWDFVPTKQRPKRRKGVRGYSTG